jgi:hypothetical protein
MIEVRKKTKLWYLFVFRSTLGPETGTAVSLG